MGTPLNAADRSVVGGGAGNGAPQTAWSAGRKTAGGRRTVRMDARQQHADVLRKGCWVSWRTVPTFIVGVLATLAVALVVLCRGPARADSPVTDRIVRRWAAVWLRAAGTRVTVHGLEHVSPAAAYVVVSNHQSNLDPMVHLRALPLSLRVLAKRELFRLWLLGRAMHAIGMIEVDRDSPDFGQIDQAAARSLAAGHSLLVYPEGTYSPDGTIGEFKDGAFIIAIASQVPILPVAIDGTRGIWPPGRYVICGGQVHIVVGSPLPTSHLTHHDVPRLREQARDVICSAIMPGPGHPGQGNAISHEADGTGHDAVST